MYGVAITNALFVDLSWLHFSDNVFHLYKKFGDILLLFSSSSFSVHEDADESLSDDDDDEVSEDGSDDDEGDGEMGNGIVG